MQLRSFSIYLLLGSLVGATPVPSKRWGWPAWEKPEAVYFMTNLKDNAVVAIPLDQNGLLVGPTCWTPTGGMGGNQVNGTGFPDGPDALASQGSVQVCGDLLFAVNAGSSTISLLSINPQEPSKLELIGEPVWTSGDFPVSIAVSKDGLVCVANGGAKSGVACATFGKWGISAFDGLRSLPFGQTTPPVGPLLDIADVFFSDDESELIVIAKGNASAINRGYIATFPVDWTTKQVSYEDMQYSPEMARVMFGATTIPGTNNLLISDAAFGALLVSLDDLANPYAFTNITDQKATCWAITSPVTGTGFVDDVAVSHLVEIDLTSGAIVSVADPMNLDQGMIDMSAAGDKIYALTPGNGTIPSAVTVFDVSGGRGTAKAVQNFAVEGANMNSEGLAVYMSGKGW